jgi:plasmid maintenance system antidote protein VapI
LYNKRKLLDQKYTLKFMNKITRKTRGSRNKTPEITRLLLVMDALGVKAADIASKTKISERTITNFIWSDTPIGAQLLRELHAKYGVSIDWLLSGAGSMLLSQTSEPSGVYKVTPSNDLRIQRMCELIQDLMDSASADEQAWLETQFKFSMRQYQQMLSSSKSE